MSIPWPRSSLREPSRWRTSSWCVRLSSSPSRGSPWRLLRTRRTSPSQNSLRSRTLSGDDAPPAITGVKNYASSTVTRSDQNAILLELISVWRLTLAHRAFSHGDRLWILGLLERCGLPLVAIPEWLNTLQVSTVSLLLPLDTTQQNKCFLLLRTSNYLHVEHTPCPSNHFDTFLIASSDLQQFVLLRGELQVMSVFPGDSVQTVSDLLQPDLQGLQASMSLAHHPSGHHECCLSLEETQTETEDLFYYTSFDLHDLLESALTADWPQWLWSGPHGPRWARQTPRTFPTSSWLRRWLSELTSDPTGAPTHLHTGGRIIC